MRTTSSARFSPRSLLAAVLVLTLAFSLVGARTSKAHAQSNGAATTPLTVPANSLIVTNGKGVTAIQLVPPAFVALGTVLRMHVQVHGRLLDGRGVKSSSYEYVAGTITGPAIPPPTCTAPATAYYCENGGFQDGSATCR